MKNSQLIKENKIAGGYTKVYPLAYVQGIYDSNNGKNLEDILKSFNHIYLPFKESVRDTRSSLPIVYRRKGVFITYRVEEELVTEVYIGKDNDVNNNPIFSADINWELVPDLEYIHNSSSKIPNGTILPEHLSSALWELLSRDHIITNFPDDEDLTQQCKVLKFKDRKYNPGLSSGKGYKILRKNWVGQYNILNKDDINHSNTIYEIRYDFDLQGQEITLMKDCVLLFKGGSLNNGTIICNNTNIVGINKFEDAGNAVFEGTFNRGLIMAKEDTIMWYDGIEWKYFMTKEGTPLPDYITAVASAYSSDTPEAEANVNPKTGVFTFRFGLPRGERGPQGPQGPGGGGIEGDTPVSHKSVMVFRTYVPTDRNPKPAKPVGGSWDVEKDIITYPEDWGPTDNVEKPVWMSTGEFSSADPADPKWSDPIMISGEDGTNGTDGVDTEFIYKLTETSLIIPNKPKSVNQTDYVPRDEGWTDSPSGISEEMQCEWVCTRKKDDNGDWSSWDGPVIWAKWGVNGTDGDGVEYIYKVNNGEALDNPTPEDTTTDEYQSRGEFEDIEYVPTELGWTDEPTGVSIENTHEWVCVRKQKNGVWQRFSNPALWAKYGEQGDNGISIRTMYAKTAGSDEPPYFVQDDINPGSIWGLIIPFYESPEAVWSITAYVTYDNKLATVETVDEEGNPITVYGWQGPVLVSGTAGKNGTPVNYKTYVYKLSDSKPNKPTSNDPKNPGDGWIDYPNTTGQWWQCIGSVNGVTELVTEWGEVLPVNGQDGIAQDGKRVEFRFAVNDSQTDAPAINKSIRQPSGWTIQPPIKEENQFMWMTVATINPDDTLAINWSDPVCISGERGPQGFDGPAGPPGPMGPNGISGIPGKDIEARYCLGTEDRYDATYNDTVANTNDPIDYGWEKTIPSVTKERLYIWCIQTSFIHERVANDSESYVRNLEYPWSKPFRLSGINGLPGKRGKSQIIYPAGIYDDTKPYTADDDKAPYVFDTSDNNFYVLNYKGTWLGKSDDPNDVDQDDRYPSQDYAANNGKYWMLMQSFDAIYANIGVFGNALVGSAVFNGDYMFSQLGIDKNGSASSNYQYFCDNNSSDPYDLDNTFRPNWCVNLRTGEQWASAGGIYLGNNSKDSFIQLISGNSTTTVSAGSIGLTTTENGQTAGFTVTDEFIKFDAVVPDEEVGGTKIVTSLDIKDDGSGSLANGKISWDKEGNLVIRGSGTSIVLSDSNSYESWQTKIDSNGVNIIKTRPRIYSNGNGGQLVANLGVDGFNVVSKTLSPTGVELAETEILSLNNDGSGSMASRSLTWDSEGNLNIKGNNSGGGNIEFVDDTPSDPQEGVLYIFI